MYALYLLFPAVFAVLLMSDSSLALLLASEDGPIEYAGALAYLGASVLALICFLKSSARENRFLGLATRRNIYFALLCILFFAAFGEEISWGQRIFGWNTPDSWSGMNAQKETNLHNLWLFSAVDEDGNRKSTLALFLNANRLVSLFWLLYCVLVPLIHLISGHARTVIRWFGFPVPALRIGMLFIINFIAFQFIVRFVPISDALLDALNETKETNYAIGFLVLMIVFYSGLRHRAPGFHSHSPQAVD